MLDKKPHPVDPSEMSLPETIQLESIREFLINPILITAFVSWVMAQVTKGIYAIFTTVGKKNFREIVETFTWRTGGMPSSHAAVVCSMVTTVAIIDGLRSNLFAVCFFLAMVVMRDALGVRRSAGHQAKALNELGRAVSSRLGFEYKGVKEIQGHKPLEVIVGAVLGIVVSLVYAWLQSR